MTILFSMDIEIILRYPNDALETLTIHLNDILIDFDMSIENMWFNTKWNKISVRDIGITSRFEALRDEKAITHLKHFVDFSLVMIIAWVNP